MRILILAASAGAGHLRAAQALEAASRESRPDVEVMNVDALDRTPTLFKKCYAQSYLQAVNHIPKVWGYFYEAYDRKTQSSRTAKVMRVLDRSVVSLDVENIGLREDEMGLMKQLINLPNGVIVCTGPTGSGKTTTLYSCLNYVNEITWKIITTEDPVEYDLEGIMQCQINEDVGLTYASCLRAILRQDPDIILVGEVRDLETAGIAVEAALTGHLVFTTLHTNDAPRRSRVCST